MKKTIVSLILITATLLAVFGMASCDKEEPKAGDSDKASATTAAPVDAEPVHTVSAELWSAAFEAENYTYTIADGKPAETVKVNKAEVAVYYSNGSYQYFSKLLDGRIIIKSKEASLEYSPANQNLYNTGLTNYENVRDFVLVNFGSFYDRFTYDETKEAYVFDGAADNKTLPSNIVLANEGCTYSHVEVSFDNGNLTKIYAVKSVDGSSITLNITDHGNTTIDIK